MEQQEEMYQESTGSIADDELALTRENVFLGEYPFEVIKESLQKQFEDYINIEDPIDYVAIFYRQMEQSLLVLTYDDEQYPTEKKELLDSVYSEFLNFVCDIIHLRLNITIKAYDEGDLYQKGLKETISNIYRFFILSAKNVLRKVILSDVIKVIGNIGEDDQAFFHIVDMKLEDYDPYFVTMDISKFLSYAADDEIYDLFDTNEVSGNFLLKYSPKFYRNDDFKVDVINSIVLYQQFNQDVQRLNQEESE